MFPQPLCSATDGRIGLLRCAADQYPLLADPTNHKDGFGRSIHCTLFIRHNKCASGLDDEHIDQHEKSDADQA